MKIVTIVGARPQFIKAAVVSRAIESFNRSGKASRRHSRNRIEEILVHTGQHYDECMDRVFFDELEIPSPRYHLGVGSGSHARQTGRMLEGIEAVLEKERPRLVLVYGDTNSTLAGALASAKLHIQIAHVEAGLRSYNRKMPEEINRVIADHLSTILFCPTADSVRNLKKEGIANGSSKKVIGVGDVMYDSVLYYARLAETRSTILRDLSLECSSGPQSPPALKLRRASAILDRQSVSVGGRDPQYYLTTLHRAENTDDPKRLRSILRAIDEIGRRAPVVFPVHPRTRKVMMSNGFLPKGSRIKLIEPVSYLNMLLLEKHAEAVLTDSGGVQKEACWLRVPCITLRDETEWVETVRSGWNTLVGADGRKILQAVKALDQKRRRRHPPKLFGDGRAGERIVEALVSTLPSLK